MVKAQQLKNGINVHLVPFAGTEAVTLLVLVKVGSRNESLPVWGGSHFIEHLMFKGTKKRPKTIDISRELDRYGAEYNAYTGKDLTGYYVKIDAQKAGVAVDLLHDMLFHSHYDAKEVTREKKVIIEEIKMYEENPIMHVEDLLEEAMFDGHVLGRNIAGTAKSMMAMRREDILKYRDAYYIPSRMVIAAAGKIPDGTLALLQKTFGTIRTPKCEPKEYAPIGKLPVCATPRARVQFKETKQIQVALGFPSYGVSDPRDLAAKMLAITLGGTMSSRLFVSVRERRGLAYLIRASNSPYEDVGNFMIQAGLDKSRLDLALKTIFNEIRSVKKHGVTAAELKLAKNYVHGKLMLQLEDSSDRAEYAARQELFLGRVETTEQFLKRVDRISRADVQKAANDVMDRGRLCLAGIGPFKTPASLAKHVEKISF